MKHLINYSGHSTDCTCAVAQQWREEQAAAAAWDASIVAERECQTAKGYTAEHDDEHGVDHLLAWAENYARREEPVKSAALIRAAREASARRDANQRERYAADTRADLEKVIADLDRARANGTVYTYGNIQERLRHTLRALTPKGTQL
jgi:chromosome segregation ATPase